MQPYRYVNSSLGHHHDYILPTILRAAKKLPHHKLFDMGCGNGASDAFLAQHGFEITAIDSSETGILLASQQHSHIKFDVASVYDDLAERFGRFPIVMSLEVIEHLYDPRTFVRRSFELLEPGGTLILSTPYNGYWKNLAVAICNGFDRHVNPLWDNGHIKFWSVRTLETLLKEAGFKYIEFHRVGRIAPLAKSMIAIART